MGAATPVHNPLPQQPDPGKAYQAVYDLLGDMYWQASDLKDKDLVFGAREEVGDIIDAIDARQFEDNTALFKGLAPKITAANQALQEIQAKVTQITRNISTAADVVSAIAKVVSLFPK